MERGLVAKVSSSVDAPVDQVWQALVTPETIKEYMFGATVKSDWTPGSPITWKGEWKGAPYEDKGKILQIEPHHRLSYSHFSPLTGQPDKPENYHTVIIELTPEPSGTLVTLWPTMASQRSGLSLRPVMRDAPCRRRVGWRTPGRRQRPWHE